MATIRKGTKLVCVLCGREIIITSSGYSATGIWCCTPTNPMVTKTEAAKIAKAAKPEIKKSGKKAAVKKPAKTKATVKKAASPTKKKKATKKAAPAKKTVKKKTPTKKKATSKKK